ncbi:metal-dependent hydrolase [Caldalkalibacillus salinus]|uniref:metal-dependent hydrolase n=1 Tax=Caldalkalibacillus salinus TaxID=2803787 RepID=UPI001922D485|nr:metal-dependent hydrolase [Caldalkalibacillus salinus]
MKITFHGQSCVQVETDQTSLIIDPFLNGNPVAKANPEDIKVSYILLTHGHNDHVGDTVQIAKQNNATVIAPFELATFLGWKGCNVHPMHIGGSASFDFGQVKFTQAFHGSAYTDEENQTITYTGMPGGILLTLEGKTIYHAGDTGLFGDMKLIGERNNIDLAFLPIGDNFTMGPEDALTAAEWVKAQKVVPMHYNTFPLIEQDAHAFADALKAKGIEGIVMEVSDTLEL